MKTKTRQWCILVAIILLVVAGGWATMQYKRINVAGAAIQQYEKLLDSQWIDKDCTLEHCPTSSISLPGMPPDRAAFTRYERFNLEWRGDYVALSAPVTDVWVYRVTKTNDGTLEAIVGIGITRCAIDSDGYSFTTDIQKMTLAPSTIAGEYVVVEDESYSGKTHNPLFPFPKTLYVSKDNGKPQCPR